MYSSPNTHLIGEAAALFIGGVVFQDLRRAEQWRAFGATTLTHEMQRQVSSEGVYCELSSYYHCYAADFYLHALTLRPGERHCVAGLDVDAIGSNVRFRDARSPGRMARCRCWAMMMAVGLSRWRPAITGHIRDGLCSGAVLFGRPDFKTQAAAFSEDTFGSLARNPAPSSKVY